MNFFVKRYIIQNEDQYSDIYKRITSEFVKLKNSFELPLSFNEYLSLPLKMKEYFFNTLKEEQEKKSILMTKKNNSSFNYLNTKN
jgi:hypothetical protein